MPPHAQSPVWMCRPEKLQTKIHTSMIIAFTGEYTTNSLRQKYIYVQNGMCLTAG